MKKEFTEYSSIHEARREFFAIERYFSLFYADFGKEVLDDDFCNMIIISEHLDCYGLLVPIFAEHYFSRLVRLNTSIYTRDNAMYDKRALNHKMLNLLYNLRKHFIEYNKLDADVKMYFEFREQGATEFLLSWNYGDDQPCP
jgi:hypothetical protein